MTNESLPSDASATSALRGFHCCCSVSREHYEAVVSPSVMVLNVIMLILTSVSATLGNVLVFVSIWRTPSLHSPSNALLVGLALSDLGVGLVVEPTYFLFSLAQFQRQADAFCAAAVLLKFAGGLFVAASLITVTVISVDMYLALYLHLRYRELVTVKRMIGVLVGIWVCSVVISLISVWYFVRLLVLWAVGVFFHLLVTTVSYFKVFRIVRYHHMQIIAQSQVANDEALHFAKQNKSSTTKFLIYCVLIVCYLPHSVMLVGFKSKDFSTSVNSIYQITFVLVCFNSALNPLIYCCRFRAIRAAVLDTLSKILRRQTASPLWRDLFPVYWFRY